jgi:hypothetical protein
MVNKQRGTKVLEESAVSIFRKGAGSFKTMVLVYQTKRHHNSKVLNLNIHFCKNLKFK